MIFSQENVRPLGVELENYEYPYPVEYMQLDVQGKELKMAYMDVHPDHPNGKSIMLMHGKNFITESVTVKLGVQQAFPMNGFAAFILKMPQ